MSENIHSGHRARLKEKFREFGLDGFTDIQALELLLMYAIPRRDTNELAHALLDRFKSFRGVLEADIDSLSEVPGIGENAATLIRLVTSMNIRYMKAEKKRGMKIENSDDAGAFLRPLFAYQQEEVAFMVCLDAASRVISSHELSRGGMTEVSVSSRNVVDIALREKAARVILAHNHPSGLALPSIADASTTIQINQALRLIGVHLMDHLIFCNDDFVSFRDSGFFSRG